MLQRRMQLLIVLESMDLLLSDKHALVCGGSKGIGGAISTALAAEGARVTIVARNEADLKSHVKSLTGSGHQYIPADLGSKKGVEQLLAKLAEEQIDIVVNNTGGPPPGPIAEATLDQFQNALEMHLYTSHEIMRLVLPHMKSKNFGRFINVISTSVKIPIQGLGVSNTTRGAMASWAKTLSNEVAADGITVNNILPGAIGTTRLDAIIQNVAKKNNISKEASADQMRATIPAGRFGEPKELGNLAAFLASDKAAYITGVSIPVDGGRTGSL